MTAFGLAETNNYHDPPAEEALLIRNLDYYEELLLKDDEYV